MVNTMTVGSGCISSVIRLPEKKSTEKGVEDGIKRIAPCSAFLPFVGEDSVFEHPFLTPSPAPSQATFRGRIIFIVGYAALMPTYRGVSARSEVSEP